MKVVELVADKTLHIKDRPLGDLAQGHCRVQIWHAGICSSDVARGFEGGAYKYPLVMGHEFSGKVIESRCSQWTIGTRVAVFPMLPCFKCESCDQKRFSQCTQYAYFGSREDGAFGEYLDVPEWNLLRIPDDVNLLDAASLEPLAVVWNAVKKSDLLRDSRPKKVLVLGCGFLGILLCRILAKVVPQAQITAVDRNDFKRDIVAKYVFRTFSTPEGGETYDVVFEVSGSSQNFAKSIEICKPNGTAVWVGNIQEDLTIKKAHVSEMMRKELRIHGVWNSHFDPQAKTDDWREALELIRNGIKPSIYITRKVGFAEIPEALKSLYLHKKNKVHFPAVKIMASMIDD